MIPLPQLLKKNCRHITLLVRLIVLLLVKIAKFTAGSMTPSPNELSPTSSSASLKSKNKSSYPYPYPSRHNF